MCQELFDVQPAPQAVLKTFLVHLFFRSFLCTSLFVHLEWSPWRWRPEPNNKHPDVTQEEISQASKDWTGLALQLESALIFYDSHISHQEDAKNVVEAGAQKKQADPMNRYE